MSASGKVLRLNTGEKMGRSAWAHSVSSTRSSPLSPGAQTLPHLISKAPTPMLGSSRGTPLEKARLLRLL